MSHLSIRDQQYPIFESNQVLSSSHLNELRTFLAAEDMATRRRAIGTGWLGGAEMEVIRRGQGLDAIRLSCGAGITSHGYLAAVADCRLEYARNYVDPYKAPVDGNSAVLRAGYDPFWTTDNQQRRTQKDQIVELLTLEEANKLKPAEKTAARQLFQGLDPTRLLVLVYVENDQRDIKSCVLEDCNERGQRMLVNCRILAMPKQHAVPSDFRPRLAPSGLRPLRLRRVLDYTGGKLKDLYAPIFSAAIADFAPAFAAAVSRFARHLAFGARPWPVANLAADLNGLRGQVPDDHQQVFYDFLRDLFATYNRFLMLGLQLAARPCPDDEAFPRHLYIGEMVPERLPLGDVANHVPPEPFPRFRHYFEGPAAPSGQEDVVHLLRDLYRRIELMLDRFRPKPADFGPRLLPQRHLGPSDNLVPYYYDLTGPDGAALRALWCHDAHMTATSPALVHHYRDLAPDQADNPLHGTIDDDAMIRAEGLYGQAAAATETVVKNLAKQFGLAVDVQLVHLSGPLPPRPLADHDAADFAYEFAALSSDWQHVLHICATALRTAIADNRHWLAFLALPPPAAAAVEDGIAKINLMLQQGAMAVDRDELERLYLELLNEAALYQAALTRYMVDVTDRKLVSPGLAVIPPHTDETDKTGTPYYMLAALALCELKRIVLGLFERLNANPLRLLLDRIGRARTTMVDLRLFEAFYKKHPGLEHIAGFTRGSTFVLLADNNKIVGDFYLPYLCCCPCADKAAFRPMSEIRPVYWEREWDKEVVLADMDSLWTGADKLRVGTKELKEGGGQVKIGGLEAALAIQKIGGRPHLVLISDKSAIGKPIRFALSAQGRHDVDFRCFVSLSMPLVIANDDIVVTVEDYPVHIPYYRNDLLPLGKIVGRHIPVPPRLGKATFAGDELYYIPDAARLQPLPAPVATRAVARQDRFDYELVVRTDTGLELRSVATVTVHIVPCCVKGITERPPQPEPTPQPTPEPTREPRPEPPPPIVDIPFPPPFVPEPPVIGVPPVVFPTPFPTPFPPTPFPTPFPAPGPAPIVDITPPGEVTVVVDDADIGAWKMVIRQPKLRAIAGTSELARFNGWGEFLSRLRTLVGSDPAAFKAGEFDPELVEIGTSTLKAVRTVISGAVTGPNAANVPVTGPLIEGVALVAARFAVGRNALSTETKQLLADAAGLVPFAREARVVFTDGFKNQLDGLLGVADNANVKRSLTLLRRAVP